MNTRLFLRQKGLFRGEFVIVIGQQRSFSIGDYIEVVLKDKPFLTGETVTGLYGEAKRIVGFPLTIVSCCVAEIDVTLSVVNGITYRLWFDCLNIGEKSIVVSYKMQHSDCTWYVPRIDGWIPGMFGKSRAPNIKNLNLV